MHDIYKLFTVWGMICMKQMQYRIFTDFGLKHVLTVQEVVACEIRSKTNTKIVLYKKINIWLWPNVWHVFQCSKGYKEGNTSIKSLFFLFTVNEKVAPQCEMFRTIT